MFLPDSHRCTVLSETPSSRATCSWLQPFSFRSFFSLGARVSIAFSPRARSRRVKGKRRNTPRFPAKVIPAGVAARIEASIAVALENVKAFSATVSVESSVERVLAEPGIEAAVGPEGTGRADRGVLWAPPPGSREQPLLRVFQHDQRVPPLPG